MTTQSVFCNMWWSMLLYLSQYFSCLVEGPSLDYHSLLCCLFMPCLSLCFLYMCLKFFFAFFFFFFSDPSLSLKIQNHPNFRFIVIELLLFILLLFVLDTVYAHCDYSDFIFFFNYIASISIILSFILRIFVIPPHDCLFFVPSRFFLLCYTSFISDS